MEINVHCESKRRHPTHVDNFAKKMIDFQNSFTDRVRTKSSTKEVGYCIPHQIL